MTTSPEFAAHCTELLSALGPTRSRRMFGGHGFYVDGIFMALATRERLYLKVDDHSRARFEAAGCTPFTFEMADGRQAVLGYWSAPDDAMESPALMQPWARLALEAALRARSAKPAKKRSRPAAAAAVSPKPPVARPRGGARKTSR